jgi:hypothetical protein
MDDGRRWFPYDEAWKAGIAGSPVAAMSRFVDWHLIATYLLPFN